MTAIRLALVVLIAYLAAVAETTLAGGLEVRDVTPSLIALAALGWQLVAAGPYAFLGAGLIALVGDLLAPGRVGAGAAAMLLLAYAVGRLQSRVRIEHYLVQAAVVMIAVSLWAAASGLLRSVLGDAASGVWSVLRQSALVGVYTAAVALPVLMVTAWAREPWLRRARRLEAS